jgi:phosphoglycolate phosphatase-like HAD superfamily hydrolase
LATNSWLPLIAGTLYLPDVASCRRRLWPGTMDQSSLSTSAEHGGGSGLASTTPVEHIIWDWNGTLLADSVASIDATIEAFAAAGMPFVTRALYQSHNTRPIPLFYDRLARRSLSAWEHQQLSQHYLVSYSRRLETAPLNAGAVDALASWRAVGGRQSLLSMHPHDSLVRLVDQHGVADFFNVIDGSLGSTVGRKAPLLTRHLARLDVRPEKVAVVGDSIDDALAAHESGVRCVLYHAGELAVHTREHLEELGVPVVESLKAAVTCVARVGRSTSAPGRSR